MEQRRLKLFISSLVALVGLQLQAETRPLPRLVVCIAVDQLRSDYLQELQPLMTDSGFRLMLKQGQYIENVDFPIYQINTASAVASIFTGTYPEVHGIESPSVYDRGIGKVRPLMWNEKYQGVYTKDKYSPQALLTGTLGDRFKEASSGASLVYSVAPNVEAALVSAGLFADGAYWIDSQIGSWATTSYYPQMLPRLSHYNHSGEGPSKRLIAGAYHWKPLREYKHRGVSFSSISQGFSYRYRETDVLEFKQSALVNEEVTNVALQVLGTAGFETKNAPGLISLTYSVASSTASELSVEEVDTYIRLDVEIERLLQELDLRIGLSNCFICLSGTGYTSYIPTDFAREKDERKISIDRLTALSGMYLTARYGSGDWIQNNANGRIYLNKNLIDSRNLSLSRIRGDLADFVRLADGISDAQSIEHIRANSTSKVWKRVGRSIHSRHEADIYYILRPGWTAREQEHNPQLQLISTAISSPCILMGGGLVAGGLEIKAIREVTDIARVICSILRIRPPNGVH